MVFAKVKKNRRLRSTLSREKQKFGMYLFFVLHNYQFTLKNGWYVYAEDVRLRFSRLKLYLSRGSSGSLHAALPVGCCVRAQDSS